MTRLSLKVVGAELVRKGLQDLTKEIPKIGREQIYQAAERARKRMRVYPSPRPGQKYVRTFKLQKGWYVQTAGDSTYRIGNEVPYTHYVVGDAYGNGQAWMHVGRWQLFRDVVEEEEKKLSAVIQKYVQMAARRHLK